jgi:Rps23 Pro-64 3,4-dihydroxylase Tpa1-like proline 4-hydroxylase
MREEIVQLILGRLHRDGRALSEQFAASNAAVGVRFCIVDDLLPESLAQRIGQAFPPIDKMRLMNSFRERKYTSKNFDEFDPLLADITFAYQDQRIMAAVETITGIKQQIPDSSLYAGGLSAMTKGHFLGPHIDNSHEASLTFYRTLNLLYYVTPDWSLEAGGNLELWDRGVTRQTTVFSRFNRLAIMETTPTSWHSVSEVRADAIRRCVSNYYFSPISPTGKPYRNVTSFSARPEQKTRRLLAWADSKVRQALRLLAPSGFGKKDIYKSPEK